jgi:hypothetical protein
VLTNTAKLTEKMTDKPHAEMPVLIVFREVPEHCAPNIYPLWRYGSYWQPADVRGFLTAEEGDRPAAIRASAPDARSGQCLDLTEAV